MITSKSCVICHKNKAVKNYYIHRDNRQGYGLNNCCKECDNKTAINLEGIKTYCNNNSRVFSQNLYDVATKAVNVKYEHNTEFNSLTEEKRESFLNIKIMKAYFSQQGQQQYYEYVKTDESDDFVEEDSEDGIKDDKEDLDPIKQGKEKKVHSEKWSGTYTHSQIDWLDSYYADTCEDFSVVSRIHKDYAKKIAKASLAMDNAYNDLMNGISGADKRYKESKAIYDTLCVSAKFSEKTRSNNDVAGLGSLSEIVAKLEQTGFLQKKITFEDDDIEKINADLRWVLSSVGGDL
ncbi:hypothetical protein [Clostridium sp.]|uniref:hypothetical protein n=1 Tax=Clostridium sp. TaxID=1506 RepID=UPI001A481423|nr:hypothetical protein [Clostridium sp.]MBK5239805.1 hypothetical protein [Clostridium sp.]